MAMSDCIKCWNTPCQCGWEFRKYNIKGIEEYINVLKEVVKYKKKHPNAEYSGLTMEVETEDDNKFMDHMNNFLKGLENASKK